MGRSHDVGTAPQSNARQWSWRRGGLTRPRGVAGNATPGPPGDSSLGPTRGRKARASRPNHTLGRSPAVTPLSRGGRMTQARIPLQALEVSLQLIDALAPMIRAVAQHDRSLMDQLRRAAQSIALNLAEALGHRAGNRRLRLETALGSAYETRT
ncbi:MAG: four helix bundle protein, partial [Myxococcales bacterium]|nr:four helix bundle protein [Myxococcales bacterium]